MSNRIGKRIYPYVKTPGERAHEALVKSAIHNKLVGVGKRIGSKCLKKLKIMHSAIS